MHRRSTLHFVTLATLLLACEQSSHTDQSPPSGRDEPQGDAASKSDAGERVERQVYALQTMVYNLDDSVTSYVKLSNTLELAAEVTLEDAREFPSYAFVTPMNGKLLVSSGEEPVITQFDIDDELGWSELASLSFANYGVGSFGAGFERHWFLNEHVAYLTHEITSRIVWDPTRFEILDVKTDSKLELMRDGLELDATFNRPPRLPAGPVLKPFYYRDSDWFRFGPNTPIAVYDPTTHEERAILDVPCPALEVASQDEQGNTYFSPWTYGPTLALFGEGPSLCVRRIKSDGTLDADWAPDLTAWTEGRPVMVFRYWRDGKALATVLHIDEVDGNFDQGYDEDLAAELDSHWRLWFFDLNAQKAHPLAGVANTSSGFHMEVLDDRAFVFVPNADWTRTTTFEIESDGSAHELFQTTGIVNNWVKVR